MLELECCVCVCARYFYIYETSSRARESFPKNVYAEPKNRAFILELEDARNYIVRNIIRKFLNRRGIH